MRNSITCFFFFFLKNSVILTFKVLSMYCFLFYVLIVDVND